MEMFSTQIQHVKYFYMQCPNIYTSTSQKCVTKKAVKKIQLNLLHEMKKFAAQNYK